MNKTLYDLEMIKSSISDDDLLKQIFKLFEEQALHTLQQMKVSCANNDWEQVFFCAHKLKSSLILFQIRSAMDDIRFIEWNAKNKDSLEEIPEKVRCLASTVEKAISQIKEENLV